MKYVFLLGGALFLLGLFLVLVLRKYKKEKSGTVLLEWRSTTKEEFGKDRVMKAFLLVFGVIVSLNLAIIAESYLAGGEVKSDFSLVVPVLLTVSFSMVFVSLVAPKSYSLTEKGLRINWALNKWGGFTRYRINRERKLLLLYRTWLGITSPVKIPIKDVERVEGLISTYVPKISREE